jgi:hypothetical protein
MQWDKERRHSVVHGFRLWQGTRDAAKGGIVGILVALEYASERDPGLPRIRGERRWLGSREIVSLTTGRQ